MCAEAGKGVSDSSRDNLTCYRKLVVCKWASDFGESNKQTVGSFVLTELCLVDTFILFGRTSCVFFVLVTEPLSNAVVSRSTKLVLL